MLKISYSPTAEFETISLRPYLDSDPLRIMGFPLRAPVAGGSSNRSECSSLSEVRSSKLEYLALTSSDAEKNAAALNGR